MTARPIFHHLEIPSGEAASATFLFEMQPILQVSDGRVMAYELLYRGPRHIEWVKVDNAVLNFLSTPQPGLPAVFVNLSNEILISLNTCDLAQAASANDVTFELSEAVSGYMDRFAIAEKVNRMIDVGARVALDDFGAGRDGLERLYSIRSASAVKIDREFMLTCMQRPDARRMLRMLINLWRSEGVKSIAEGVENEAMFTFARELDVDLVQGWFVDSLVGMKLVTESAGTRLPRCR